MLYCQSQVPLKEWGLAFSLNGYFAKTEIYYLLCLYLQLISLENVNVGL